MRLEKFRVTNFRNIDDSGWIQVSGTMALVGRNESGKTNLLQALFSLNPGPTLEPLSVVRDFPANRLPSEYTDDLPVVVTSWRLSEEERSELTEIMPGAAEVETVEVGRGYPPHRWLRFQDVGGSEAPVDKLKSLLMRLEGSGAGAEGANEGPWAAALDTMRGAVARRGPDLRGWASGVGEAVRELREAGPPGSGPWADEARRALDEIGELAKQIADRSHSEDAARQWVLWRMPRFLYLDEFPDIEGHMDLTAFARRRREGHTELRDHYFEMLMRVAGLDPDGIDELLATDQETRRQVMSRAGAGLTRRLRQLWTDRSLKVRFNLDGADFDTLVSDPTAACDVEVNLNQRSRGFRWFFSFFVMMAASGADSAEGDAVLLLDEPGLHLHSIGQRNLLERLCSIPSQALLTTQSPFLVPSGPDAGVATVTFCEERGSTVAPGLTEDVEAIPVAQDDGLERIASALFGTTPRLVVEDITDYWYLRTISSYLEEQGRPALPPELVVTPAGGASLVPCLLSMLGRETTTCSIVLSSRPVQEETEGTGPLFVGVGLGDPPSRTVELEDLLDPEVYDRFVRFAYRNELEGREMRADLSLPNAVRRYEQAFARVGLQFSRSRPARLIASGSTRNLRALLAREGAERFERLFREIQHRYDGVRS